jgi:hypothetical protein
MGAGVFVACTYSLSRSFSAHYITTGRDDVRGPVLLPAPLVQRATSNGIEATLCNHLDWAAHVDLAMAEQGRLLRCTLAHLKRTPVHFQLEPRVE